MAVRSGIPILYLSSTPVSKQIRGIPHAIDVRICRDPETMSANVRNWLRSQRGPLLKGPNRRTDRHLAYVKVTAQIEVAWNAAMNHSVVAAQLGLHPNAIFMSAVIATCPADEDEAPSLDRPAPHARSRPPASPR